MMTEEEANSVTHLTLTGKLNAEDFRHLRDEFDNLKVLDIRTLKSRCTAKSGNLSQREILYLYAELHSCIRIL